MDAIKKKMMAMKLEKENACDRADQLEQSLKDEQDKTAKVSCSLQSIEQYNESGVRQPMRTNIFEKISDLI